jgi:hypothetical protein
MNINITKTIVLLTIITLILFFVSEYSQNSQNSLEPYISNKKKVRFNDNIQIKHFYKDESTNTKDKSIERNKGEPDAYDKTTKGKGNSWEDAFKTGLLDSKSKTLQKKILNSSERYAGYNTDHQLIMYDDVKISQPFILPDKEESVGKTIKEIYDSKTANVKPVPKKLKSRGSNSWEYEDECGMNGGELNTKGLMGNDSNSNMYGDISYQDDFSL